MSVAPQIDLETLHRTLNQPGRKMLDEVTEMRISKIVKALKAGDKVQGSLATAMSYIYFNKIQEAIDIAESMISQFGQLNSVESPFFDVLLEAYQAQGNFLKAIEVYNEYFTKIMSSEINLTDKDLATIKRHLANSVNMHKMYAVDNIDDLRMVASQEKLNVLVEYIADKKQKLENMNISVKTYQNFVSITNRVVNTFYNEGFTYNFNIQPEFDLAELVIYFDEITPREALDLNNKIDDAILEKTLNDEVFAREVMKLTTYCKLRFENLQNHEINEVLVDAT